MSDKKANKGMEIVYRVNDGLYINLTNKCSSSCTFCLRNSMDNYGMSNSLWLEREPAAEEVIDALKKWNMHEFDEIVFCGYGEPMCALSVLLDVAFWIKSQPHPLKIRINTNGHGNLIAGEDVAPKLKGLIDTVSISLNHPDPKKYQELVRSKFGDAAYPAMLEFARQCVEEGIKVIMTTVDTTITHEEEEQCGEICKSIGASYRIRELISHTAKGVK